MTNFITVLIFAVLLIGAMLAEMAFGAQKDIPMKVLDKCIVQELEACPDKLCEMSYDSNFPVINQAFINLKDCIEKEMKK